VGDAAAFDPMIDGGFGVGDIAELSFLEFLELIQVRLVNARNRKVITDHRGGWYPTLLKVYTTYLSRSTLDDNDPLKTNGYTFENLYPFLNKYNAFFQRFVDTLLPATIIQRKGGLLIRNTIFTKQKFTYKRGVSFDPGLNYFGDDGATYLKRPLQQSVDWSDDYICLPDLCENLVVSGITVTYPTTTTTTTVLPYLATLFVEEFSSYYYSDGSLTESSITYRLRFDPAIPPGYTVNVDIETSVDINLSAAVVTGVAQVFAKKNGTPFINYTEEEYVNGSYSFTPPSTQVSMTSGDVVDISLFNLAEATGGTAESYTLMIPTIDSVTPSGSISAILPSEVDNSASV
jgi:hypothetical protein